MLFVTMENLLKSLNSEIECNGSDFFSNLLRLGVSLIYLKKCWVDWDQVY